MRPLLCVVMALLVLGGLQGYMWMSHLQRQSGKSPITIEQAEGTFHLEVTLSFDAGPDLYSLDAGDDQPSVLIQSRGIDLLRQTGLVSHATPIRIDDVPEVVVGMNEFFVEVSPSSEFANGPTAVRIRVFRDQHPVAEQTLWSESGTITGTLRIEIPRET